MGQKLGNLWGRVQGKQQMETICDVVFDQCVRGTGRDLLPLNDLHRAILLVYNALNRYHPGTHMEPPTSEQVQMTIEDLRKKNVEVLNREQFHQITLKWISKYLPRLLVTKVVLALMIAPGLARMTKNAGKSIPRIGNVVERVPTPVLTSAYTIGLVLIQDAGVPAA